MRTKMPTSILLVFILSFVISDAASNQYSDVFRAYPGLDVPYSSTGSYIVAAPGANTTPVDIPLGLSVSVGPESDTQIAPTEIVESSPQPILKNIPKKTSASPTIVVHTDEIVIFPELLETAPDAPSANTANTDSDIPLRDSVLQAMSEF